MARKSRITLKKILSEYGDEVKQAAVESINAAADELESAIKGNMDKAGIKAQLANTANFLLLGNALHMASNARSLLSLNRHESYRRVLCNFVGRIVENGEYPADWENLGNLIENICYNNAKLYFANEK